MNYYFLYFNSEKMLKKLLLLFVVFVGLFGFWFAKDYIYFYSQWCPHCTKVSKFFEENKIEDKFKIEKKEVMFNQENRQVYSKYCTKLSITPNEQAVPFLVINDWPKCEYRMWDTPIIQYFKNEMWVTWDNTTKVDSSWTQLEDDWQSKLSWKFLAVMIPAAVSDSINPCEFAIMLLLLSSILIKHKSRKKAVVSWLLFSLSIFISYYLMWLWLYKALSQATNVFYLKLFVWILWIVVWLANLKDYFWYWKWFVMEVPFSRRPKMASLVQTITSPLGAFFIWFIVSLFLLPCTSWPYLTILWVLSAQGNPPNITVYILLAIYNLFFVLPMLLITGLIWFGVKSIDELNKMKEENKYLIHLLVWVLMIWLWVYVLLNNFWVINF